MMSDVDEIKANEYENDEIDIPQLQIETVYNRKRCTAHFIKVMERCSRMELKLLESRCIYKPIVDEPIDIPQTILSNNEQSIISKASETCLKNAAQEQTRTLTILYKLSQCPIAQRIANL